MKLRHSLLRVPSLPLAEEIIGIGLFVRSESQFPNFLEKIFLLNSWINIREAAGKYVSILDSKWNGVRKTAENCLISTTAIVSGNPDNTTAL